MISTMTQDDLAHHARAILQANLYLTLGTVGADGRPWTAPVYFAPAGDREFVWVSMTNARHSEHLTARPDVSLVVFDSTVRPYHGRAVYALGQAHEVRTTRSTARSRSIPGRAAARRP